MKVVLLCIGKTDEKYLQEGCDIYLKRLKHYFKTELTVIPDLRKAGALSPEERKVKEGEEILKKIEPTDRLILLDERGKTFTSRKFATFLQKQANTGAKRTVFVIGGAFGFSDEVYAKADDKISLSTMTFSHQMIRLFFLEQLYRGCTILNNEPYHND